MKGKNELIVAVIIAAFSITVTAGGVVVSKREAAGMTCTGICVELADSASNMFTTPEEITGIIDRDFGGYLNCPLRKINTCNLEKLLMSKGFLEDCQAYFTPDSILHVYVRQRTPVLCMKKGEDLWYADCEGHCIKVASDWCKGIPHIDGFPETEESEWTAKAAGMAGWISNSMHWRDKVGIIHCDLNGDLALKLADHEEAFLFGQPENVESKFSRIDKYLGEIAPRGNEYKTVNLKYRGQIICR